MPPFPSSPKTRADLVVTHHARMLRLQGNKLAQWSKVWWLVWGHRWRGVQYKMLTGDEWREGLVRHWQMLHCTCLDQLWKTTKEKYTKDKQIISYSLFMTAGQSGMRTCRLLFLVVQMWSPRVQFDVHQTFYTQIPFTLV